MVSMTNLYIHGWSTYVPRPKTKQPCKSWDFNCQPKNWWIYHLGHSTEFCLEPHQEGSGLYGSVHVGWSSGGFSPPQRLKNPLGSDRQEELFWEVFFFWWQIFGGTKKRNASRKLLLFLLFFCLLFFWWMLNAFAVLMNNWSFNNFLSTIFFWVLILIYETFCHTKQDFRHNFSESLGLSSGVFGLSTFTTLGPPNFGSEIGSREIRKSPAFSSGKREVKYYSRNGQILRWAYFPPKFTGSRTWEMMAKEDDPFASFWGKT